MSSNIVKQVDPDYAGDQFVGFITAHPHWRGDGLTGEMNTGDTFTAELHRRPIIQYGFIRSCGHDHRSVDAAVRCMKRLLKAQRGVIQ